MRVANGMHHRMSRWTFGGAAEFAARLTERHGGARTQSLPQLSRVLRRLRRVVVTSVGGNLTFAPRIDVRLASFGRHASEAPLVARSAMGTVPRDEHHTVSARSAEAMIQRSKTRGVRSDRGATHKTGGVPAAVTVLRRSSATIVQDTSPAARDERSVRLPVQPRLQQLSPVEVDRLTDHIVHTIDRRIAAFRERRGRM